MKTFWQRLLTRFGRRDRKKSAVCRGSSRRFRPNLETLEAREVPTLLIAPHFGPETVASTGGPVLLNTPVYLVFEGNYWNNPTGITRQDVVTSAQNIFASSYASGLGQYGSNGFAYLAGTFADTSMPTTTDNSGNVSFVESDLANVALANVQNVFTAASSRPIYFVVTAPNISDSTRPTAGGFHNEITYEFKILFGQIAEQIPFDWVGSFGTTRSSQTDNFSGIFSHEFVETMSDPFIASNPGIKINHAASYRADHLTDEIADFEPDGRYEFRLNDGSVAQAYWSAANGAYLFPDGTSQTFNLTPLWTTVHLFSGYAQTSFNGDYNLTVNGDQLSNKDDNFTIATISSGPNAGGVMINLNGETVSFAAGQIASIVLNTGVGNDTVDIESLPRNVALTVYTGAGNDVVNLAQTSGQPDMILGPVTVQGGGATTLSVHDQASTVYPFVSHSLVYNITGNSLTRTDASTVTIFGRTQIVHSTTYYTNNVTFSDVNNLVINGGQCPAVYYLNTASLSTPTTIWGGGANNSLIIDDSATSNNDGTAYYVTPDNVTRVGTDRYVFGTFPIIFNRQESVSFYDIPAITLDGGASGNGVNVENLGGDENFFLNPGAGTNTVTVGDANGLDDLHGGLNVYGGGTNTLVLNDLGVANTDTASNNVSFAITDQGVVRTNVITFNPGTADAFTQTNSATITTADLAALIIEGGPTGNVFNVETTTATEAITIDTGAGDNQVNVLSSAPNSTLFVEGGGASDLVRIGSVSAGPGDTEAEGGLLAAIAGAVQVDSSTGTTTLVIDNSADPNAYSDVSIGMNDFTSGASPATITWSVTNAIIRLGGTAGQPGNQVNIDGGAIYGSIELFDGPGDNTVNVNDPYASPNAAVALIIHAQGGNDTVSVNDQNATDGALYEVSGDQLTRTGGAGMVLTLNMDSVSNLNVNTGDGIVQLDGVDTGLSVLINGTPPM